MAYVLPRLETCPPVKLQKPLRVYKAMLRRVLEVAMVPTPIPYRALAQA